MKKDKKKQKVEGEDFTDSTLLSDQWYRTIEVNGDIDSEICMEFIKAIHQLLAEDPHEMITIFISSNGGYTEEGFAMYDMVRYARKTCNVRVICYARCYSMATLILASGSRGHRFAYPSSTAMLHGLQLDGIVTGNVNVMTAPLVQNCLDESIKYVDYLAYELAKDYDENGEEIVGISEEQLNKLRTNLKDTINTQDSYFTPEEMVAIKLVDNVGIPDMIPFPTEVTQESIVNAVMESQSNQATNYDKWSIIHLDE